MIAQPLRRNASGKTYVDLADAVFEGETEDDLLEEYDYVRKEGNVGYVRLKPRTYEFGPEVIVP